MFTDRGNRRDFLRFLGWSAIVGATTAPLAGCQGEPGTTPSRGQNSIDPYPSPMMRGRPGGNRPQPEAKHSDYSDGIHADYWDTPYHDGYSDTTYSDTTYVDWYWDVYSDYTDWYSDGYSDYTDWSYSDGYLDWSYWDMSYSDSAYSDSAYSDMLYYTDYPYSDHCCYLDRYKDSHYGDVHYSDWEIYLDYGDYWDHGYSDSW